MEIKLTLNEVVEQYINTSQYNEACELIQKAFGFEFSAVFDRNGKHFDSDKDNRSIYTIKLSRNKLSYSFKFGQSIVNSGKNRKAPTLYDVLTCLQKYDVGSLNDFCGDFGYNIDSKSVERIYKAVCKEYQSLCTLFSDSELETLQLIC